MTLLPNIQIVSTIKCINCGHKETQRMPEYAAKTFYECPACTTVHRPLENKCCIYCSYGNVLCPPTQRRIRLAQLGDAKKEFMGGKVSV